MSYSEHFEQALLYATELHRHQYRKGTQIPYVTHLLAVAAIVAEYGGTEEQVIAALLHDGPEDQGGLATLAEIRRRFGETVARIVEGCSDTFEQPKPPWRARKESYIAHLQSADADVLLVSAADKLHNARTLLADLRLKGDAAFERFTGKKEGTLWYYDALLHIFQERFRRPIVEELARVVEELHRLRGYS